MVFLAVIALSVGRTKDFMRILALLESESTNAAEIEALAGQFTLSAEWSKFSKRCLDEEPS